ncbi:MAG TPA: glycosyl hydrolase family 31, partial [Candidatus Kryptobacter bacterium]|nr:glycosyl hydrolase family 31 [Candidatus Kryptobacter bacterium]
MKRIESLFFCFLLAALFTFSAGWSRVLAQEDNPVADPKATVIEGSARFTILTPGLVRMEWSQDGKFIDSPSLVFINRRLPVPVYRTSTDGGWLVIQTNRLTLRYKKGSGEFNSGNLLISFTVGGQTVVWYPGEKDTANLYGTIRTLDGVKGPIALAPGLLSRSGWALV